MSWVSVPQDYDAPFGERIRIIFEVNVPEWLGWIPSQIIQYIIDCISSIWTQILNAHPEFNVEKYEVIQITPLKYHLIIYGTSKGVPVWIVATIILGLILAIIIAFNITLKDVQKYVPPETISIIPILLILFLALLLLREKK